jgi:hypothetical protein
MVIEMDLVGALFTLIVCPMLFLVKMPIAV